MLIKNIVKIERGTLIKGLTVKPFGNYVEPNKNSRPRIATLNVDGWEYPDPTFFCPVIRTMVYLESSKPSSIKPVTYEKIKEVGIDKCTIEDPWNSWTDYKFIEFKKDEPIGVHMGEFVIGHISKKRKSYVNFYTKVLLISGEMVYLTLETEQKGRIEAELI